jgi:hypothetical protein
MIWVLIHPCSGNIPWLSLIRWFSCEMRPSSMLEQPGGGAGGSPRAKARISMTSSMLKSSILGGILSVFVVQK